MASVKVRRQQALDAAHESVRYGECSRHRRHVQKADARRTAREHVRAVRDGILRCWKCRDGRTISICACYDWQKHYHWGHEV